jgi:cytochrome P450
MNNVSTSQVPKVNLTDPEIQKCPFHTYARLHDQGKIFLDEKTGFYEVIDYDTVSAIASVAERFSVETGLVLARETPVSDQVAEILRRDGYPDVNSLATSDDPDHRFHRSLVDKAFTASRVKKMEAYLRELAIQKIEAILGMPEIDFVAEIGVPLPMTVIADQMGLPADRLDTFRHWSDAGVARAGAYQGDERELQLTRELCNLQTYLAEQAIACREQPRDNLLSEIANASDEGERLDMPVLVSILVILFLGGNETTANAMANGVLRLAENPGLQDALRLRPETIPEFVEEVLRMDSPTQALFRRAVTDVEIGDTKIPSGALLALRWGAANRDPKRFEDPDAFKPGRSGGRNHLAFGLGSHFCVGHQLARRELTILYEEMLKRMNNIRLSRGHDSVVRIAHNINYGPTSLYIAFDRIA